MVGLQYDLGVPPFIGNLHMFPTTYKNGPKEGFQGCPIPY